MEDFKILDFESENGKGSFPLYKEISGSEVTRVSLFLKRKLNLLEDSANETLVLEVGSKSELVASINLQESPQDLLIVMEGLKLELDEWVYLNWGKYEVFDEMKLEDLLVYLDDIWFPYSDDLDIIDPRCRWLVSIHHSGMVRRLRFEKNETIN